jgi:hypothetical protein
LQDKVAADVSNTTCESFHHASALGLQMLGNNGLPATGRLPADHACLPCLFAMRCLQEKEGDDPSRVGGAQNPLTGGGGLSTGIAKAQVTYLNLAHPGRCCGCYIADACHLLLLLLHWFKSCKVCTSIDLIAALRFVCFHGFLPSPATRSVYLAVMLLLTLLAFVYASLPVLDTAAASAALTGCQHWAVQLAAAPAQQAEHERPCDADSEQGGQPGL